MAHCISSLSLVSLAASKPDFSREPAYVNACKVGLVVPASVTFVAAAPIYVSRPIFAFEAIIQIALRDGSHDDGEPDLKTFPVVGMQAR